jgi:hypothetical protein
MAGVPARLRCVTTIFAACRVPSEIQAPKRRAGTPATTFHPVSNPRLDIPPKCLNFDFRIGRDSLKFLTP